MYTDSVEHEKELLYALWRTSRLDMENGETTVGIECPCCHEGHVLTRCLRYTEGNVGILKHEYFCDACGERFVLNRIEADIFFHKPYQMLDKLETQIGDIFVWVNGKSVPFRCRRETYVSERNEPGKSVAMHVIDVDLRGLKPGDEIFCGYTQEVLELFDGDEHAVLYAYEDEEQMIGFCGYDTDDDEVTYCFRLEPCNNRGFAYRIIADPKQFDVQAYYPSVFITLAVSQIKKEDYDNPDQMTFTALISVIE